MPNNTVNQTVELTIPMSIKTLYFASSNQCGDNYHVCDQTGIN